MNRVRGKSILWLSLIAILFGSMAMLPTVSSQTVPRLYISPSVVPTTGWGHPGDVYTISVNIENAEDLWAAGFKINFAPYASVVAVSNFQEGGFLSEEGTWNVVMATQLDIFHGTLYVALTRTPSGGDDWGVWGNGTLFTFRMAVMYAGNSLLDLTETTLLGFDRMPIVHTVTNGFYNGIYVGWGKGNSFGINPTKKVYVGDTFYLDARVKNPTDTPMYVRVRFDLLRDEDGRRFSIYTGQEYIDGGIGELPTPRYEYLYANGYTNTYGVGYGWNFQGTSPYLGAVGDGNYIWTDMADPGPIGFPIVGKFDFQDSSSFVQPVDWTREAIDKVEIEGYTLYASGLDEGNDLDTYMRFPDVAPYPPTIWVGSLWGDGTWGWHTVRWTTDPVSVYYPVTLTEAGLDMARVRYIMYWTADDVAHGRVDVDALRLKVEIRPNWAVPLVAPSYEILPGQELQLPSMMWTAKPGQQGHYTVQATVEYTAELVRWNYWGSNPKGRGFQIRPFA
jgi:hypothetical protein